MFGILSRRQNAAAFEPGEPLRRCANTAVAYVSSVPATSVFSLLTWTTAGSAEFFLPNSAWIRFQLLAVQQEFSCRLAVFLLY